MVVTWNVAPWILTDVSEEAVSFYVWLRAGRPGDWGSIPGKGKRIFPLTSVSRPAGDQPASCPMGTGGPFSGAKTRPGRDADHAPPFRAEAENE
jgi:hypothetical protein